jgi:osmotically-inducible protein OsmY
VQLHLDVFNKSTFFWSYNMNLLLSNLVLRSTIILTMLFTSSVTVAATASQEIIDARQESQIWTTYALSPYLRANDIKVLVQNGKATLTGKVDEDVNKDLAKQIALGVPGIKEVDNQIQVLADYKPTPSERSYGEVIDDVSISAAVKSKLIWSKTTDSQAIDVATQKGKVILTGTAASAEAKELAGRLASSTRGVESVTNNLVISKTPMVTGTAKASASESTNAISDTWITTKVKSTFMYSSNVDGSDIDVSTSSGVVTLSGKLESGAERALAIELAQNVRGVKSVQAKNLLL